MGEALSGPRWCTVGNSIQTSNLPTKGQVWRVLAQRDSWGKKSKDSCCICTWSDVGCGSSEPLGGDRTLYVTKVMALVSVEQQLLYEQVVCTVAPWTTNVLELLLTLHFKNEERKDSGSVPWKHSDYFLVQFSSNELSCSNTDTPSGKFSEKRNILI